MKKVQSFLFLSLASSFFCLEGQAPKDSSYYSQLLTELLQVCGDAVVGGNLLACGTITGTGAQGPPGPAGPPGATGPAGLDCCNNYIYSYDSTVQQIAVANTYQNITLNTNGVLDGWEHTVSTAPFTCRQTGTYRIAYDARCASPTIILSITFRVLKDGIEIPHSTLNRNLVVIGGTSFITMSKAFLVDIVQDEVIIFQFQGNSTAVRLFPQVSGTVIPSFAVSISRVS